MRHLLFTVLVLCCSLVQAQPKIEEPEPLPPAPITQKKPAIRMPMLPPGDVPIPPVAVTELQSDTWFVIESEVQCIVLASRLGLVSISSETGPMKLRGIFADGGKVETRSYTGKYLYTVEPITAGTVEILIVPAGATDASTVIRRTLSVLPPKPVPICPPVPVPPAPIVVVPPVVPPGPGPGPGPVAPPVVVVQPVQEKFGMIEFTSSSILANVPVEKRISCAAFSANFSMVAAKIVALQITTLADANTALKAMNQVTAGTDLPMWTVVIKAGNTRMNQLVQDGKFDITNMDDVRIVFSEIAAGFLAAGSVK